MTAAVAIDGDGGRGFSARLLDGVETLGNKVPHPVMMFVYLIVFVIVLSTILHSSASASPNRSSSRCPPVEHNFYPDTTQPDFGPTGLAWSGRTPTSRSPKKRSPSKAC